MLGLRNGLDDFEYDGHTASANTLVLKKPSVFNNYIYRFLAIILISDEKSVWAAPVTPWREIY
jgi:hypothetical protein